MRSSFPTSSTTAPRSKTTNWLPRLVSGEYIGAIAMTEPSGGSDLQAVKTTAKRSRQSLCDLTVSKTFITNGQLANFIIVVAKTDPAQGAKGISLFAIETEGARGLHARAQSRQDRTQGQ